MRAGRAQESVLSNNVGYMNIMIYFVGLKIFANSCHIKYIFQSKLRKVKLIYLKGLKAMLISSFTHFKVKFSF